MPGMVRGAKAHAFYSAAAGLFLASARVRGYNNRRMGPAQTAHILPIFHQRRTRMTQMEYLKQQLLAVLAIDSPTGHTAAAAQYVLGQYRALGFSPC